MLPPFAEAANLAELVVGHIAVIGERPEHALGALDRAELVRVAYQDQLGAAGCDPFYELVELVSRQHRGLIHDAPCVRLEAP